jgi:two-component sensor histidine kinase
MVLTELLQNAVEHAFPTGGGTIELRCRRTPERLVVSVTDDGAGLPAGFDLATSASLGLSIVRTLVAELDGRIEMGGRVAEPGTRVEVEIPL